MQNQMEERTMKSESLMPKTLTLHDKQWYYKGEGNVNVVLAVPSDGTVVRVMKNDGNGPAGMSLPVLVRYRDALDRLFFVGCDYTDVPTLMMVSTDELQDIDRRVRNDRPLKRQHKNLGWAGGLVAVCPDYTLLSPLGTSLTPRVYCVELKPKQGWLHEADRAARGNLLGAKCAFCAHQYLKLSRGDVREVSQYCPLDLFSGHHGRARSAIRRLFHTPQNNLKMFVDGVPVDERDFEQTACKAFGNVCQLSAFIATTLLGVGHGKTVTNDVLPGTDDYDHDKNESPRVDQSPCNFDAVPMPEHCVLHKILTMMKMQTTGFAAVCSAFEQSKCTTQFDHVDRLLLATRPESIQSPVDGYLVAATAQDCSVFVTFSEVAQENRTEWKHIVQFGDLCYKVCVKVSDLDPKPLSTIKKHQKRNANVLLAYNRYFDKDNSI